MAAIRTGVRRFRAISENELVAVAAPPPPPIVPPSLIGARTEDVLELRSWIECFDEREEPEVLAGGIIAGDRTFISADGGVGKTWLGLWLALQIAAGRRFGRGEENPKPRQVWWADLEMSRNQFLGGVEKIVRGMWPMGDYPSAEELGLHWDSGKRINLDTDDGALRLLAFLKTHGVTTLFVDSFAKITDGDENAKEAMQPVLDRLSHIHHEMEKAGLELTSCVIAHESKMGAGLRGSGAIRNTIDSLLRIKADGEKMLLWTDKSRNGPHYKIEYTPHWAEDRTGRNAFYIGEVTEIEINNTPKSTKSATVWPVREVVEELLRGGRKLTATELKKQSESSKVTVYPAQLKKLVDDGIVAFDPIAKLYRLA